MAVYRARSNRQQSGFPPLIHSGPIKCNQMNIGHAGLLRLSIAPS
jgi:hypothetical protein